MWEKIISGDRLRRNLELRQDWKERHVGILAARNDKPQYITPAHKYDYFRAPPKIRHGK